MPLCQASLRQKTKQTNYVVKKTAKWRSSTSEGMSNLHPDEHEWIINVDGRHRLKGLEHHQ